MRGVSIKQGLVVVAQVCGFWAISELGYAIVTYAGIPLPGNMVGMVILFVLLSTGIVRLKWVEAAATLLLRHLAFFFVPIAVGLMSMGDLLRSHGVALVTVLLASAAVGIVCAGTITQAIAQGKEGDAPATLSPAQRSESAR